MNKEIFDKWLEASIRMAHKEIAHNEFMVMFGRKQAIIEEKQVILDRAREDLKWLEYIKANLVHPEQNGEGK